MVGVACIKIYVFCHIFAPCRSITLVWTQQKKLSFFTVARMKIREQQKNLYILIFSVCNYFSTATNINTSFCIRGAFHTFTFFFILFRGKFFHSRTRIWKTHKKNFFISCHREKLTRAFESQISFSLSFIQHPFTSRKYSIIPIIKK